MSVHYMLDTNIVSHIIKGNDPVVLKRVTALSMDEVEVSVITEAELMYGLIKHGSPAGLKLRIAEFLIRVNVIPWDSNAALAYGTLRNGCQKQGVALQDMDMLIAAHALAQRSVLVSRDSAFGQVSPQLGLNVETW